MPNRGPLSFSGEELKYLLGELPEHYDLADAEDAEDRKRMSCLNGVRDRVSSATVDGESGVAVVTLSIDEIDSMLDCFGPPTAVSGGVRQKLSNGRLHILNGEVGPDCDNPNCKH